MEIMYSSLVRHIHRFPNVEWDYVSLSSHPYVTLVTLKALKDKPWNWNILSTHVNWNWNWVREFPNKPWNWRVLSKSNFFKWDWVREFPDKPWCWEVLSNNIESISTVKEFPDKPWVWYTLTLGPVITIKDMVENPNFPWTINELLFTEVDEEIIGFLRFFRSHYDVHAWCDHTSRTPWKLIKQNLDLPWMNWFIRIRNSDEFKSEDVFMLEKSNWNWEHLSEHLDFKTIISQFPHFPWNYDYVSRNKTVSYKDLMRFPELPWDYNFVQLEDEAKEWNAACTIKRFWNRSVTDPAFSLCRKIVLGDLFGALNGRDHPCNDKSDD